ILWIHATAKLHAARPGSQGCAGRHLIAWPQGNDVPPVQVVPAVQAGKIGGTLLGDEIGPEAGAFAVAEGTADDLYHLAVMQIDAGSELHESWSAGEISRQAYTGPGAVASACVAVAH